MQSSIKYCGGENAPSIKLFLTGQGPQPDLFPCALIALFYFLLSFCFDLNHDVDTSTLRLGHLDHTDATQEGLGLSDPCTATASTLLNPSTKTSWKSSGSHHHHPIHSPTLFLSHCPHCPHCSNPTSAPLSALTMKASSKHRAWEDGRDCAKLRYG